MRLEVALGAKRVFERAGFRCTTLPEFACWYEGALGVQGSAATAAGFCADCMRCVREDMAAQGRCVREDTQRTHASMAAEIRATYVPRKVSMQDLAAKHGVSKTHIYEIVSGEQCREKVAGLIRS